MSTNDYNALISAARQPENSYERLISELCGLLKLDSTQAIAAGNPFVMSGIRISLEGGDSNAISIYVEMGHPPKDGEATVLRTLLMRNFLVAQTRGPSYCISTVTGKVLCVAHFLATSMTGKELLGALQTQVDQALEWRSDHFLWDSEKVDAI